MIRIKKGLDIPIAGLPEQVITEGNSVNTIALLGDDYIGMKPALAVAEGDHVQAGQMLFADKKVPAIRYTAPVSGKVTAICRGSKRKFLSLIIERDETPLGIEFASWSHKQIKALSKNVIVEQLLASGMWCAFRARPYSKIPTPDVIPHSIFITAMDTRPLAAEPHVVILFYQEDFLHGLHVISALTAGKVYVCTKPNVELGIHEAPVEQIAFSGPHPAGLPGTHIHFIDPVYQGKTVWHVGYQDVIAIGKLFNSGQLWQERIIALGGPSVKRPRLIKTVPGACLEELTCGELKDNDHRLVSGSVLGGRHAKPPVNFLGRYHLQVSALEEGVHRTFLHYLSLGKNRYSSLPIYLSYFSKQRFNLSTSTCGSPRALVPIGSYERIMPLDILPTQLLRALIVGDIEMAEKLGMLELDEEDVALCTFVCPGKYEYGPILRDNLTSMEKEG